MMRDRRVSITVPTLNRSRYLGKTVKTILKQTYKDFELLIVDDGSTDSTPEVARRFTVEDSRVRYIRNEHNLGIPAVQNRCLALARGELIAILHDHDLYAEDFLEECVALLDRAPNVGYVATALNIINESGQEIARHIEAFDMVEPGEKIAKAIVRRWNCPIHASAVVRRSAYNSVGLYDESLGFVSDVDMWIRLALRYDVGYIPRALVGLRVREKNHLAVTHRTDIIEAIGAIHYMNARRVYGKNIAKCAFGLARWKSETAARLLVGGVRLLAVGNWLKAWQALRACFRSVCGGRRPARSGL